MIYKITFYINTDDTYELEDVFEELGIDYKLEEVQESEVQ